MTGAAGGAAIRLDAVSRRFGAVEALRDVSCEVPAGALCGLIGPNGAGKTTLLHILATVDDLFAGAASLAGVDVRQDPLAARAKLGFVPDQRVVGLKLSVGGFLEFFAGAQGVPRDRRATVVEGALERAGLAAFRDRPADALSTGMTQRLLVARALLHEPEVLLLDEPASGLDPRARVELKELLKALCADGKTVLVSSHILTELGDFCDHVLVLEQGALVAAGTIASLWDEASAAGRADEQTASVLFEVAGDVATAEEIVGAFPAIRAAAFEGGVFRVQLAHPRETVPALVRALALAGVEVHQVVPQRRNLEALFLSMTDGALQ